METNEIAVLKNDDGVKLYDIDGKEIKKEVYHVTWDIAAAEKGGYDYFMMKEIMEQPEALKKTIQPRVTESGIHLEDVSLTEEEIKNCGRIHIVAGSAMHAGVVGRYVIEEEPAVSPLRWISHPNSDTETLSLRKMTSASSSARAAKPQIPLRHCAKQRSRA